MLTYTNLSKRQILYLLETETICQLGTMNPELVEIVPMFYTFTYEDDVLNVYFITSSSGQKMDNMKDTGVVCVELTRSNRHRYDSVMANGNARVVRDRETKAMILRNFKQKYGSHHHFFKDCEENKLTFIMVNISDITGRRYYI